MSSVPQNTPDSQNNMKGAFIALGFGFIQVCNDAAMKALTADLGFYQILMARGLALLPLIILILLWRDELFVRLGKRDKNILTFRVFCEIGLSYSILKALSSLPLASVIIIFQAVPLGLTLAAALVYKEAVGWRRWLAIIAGFIGVLLIVKPGTDGFMPEMLYAVVGATLFVVRDIITRQLSAKVPAFYTAFQQVLWVTIVNGILCYFDEWVPLEVYHYGLLFLAGLLFLCMTLAAVLMMRYGDISFVAQFRYAGIVWAIIIGALLFQEVPDLSAIIGASIIVSAGLYALHRERMAKQSSSNATS